MTVTVHDANHLAQLRKDCEANNIDFSRGTIKVDADGAYVVHLDKPLWSIGHLVDEVPGGRTFASAIAAEGHLLQGLLVIQRAERKHVRLGRVVGWDTASIVRKPLSEAEVAAYREVLAHNARVAQLQTQLSEALARRQAKASADAEAAIIRARYGIAASKPEPVVQSDEPVAPADAPAPVADFDPNEILAALGAEREPVQAPMYAGKRLAAPGRPKSTRGK